MNILSLIPLIYSKRFSKEILMFIQAALFVMTLSLVIQPFFELYGEYKLLSDFMGSDSERYLYYTPKSGNTMTSEEIKAKISEASENGEYILTIHDIDTVIHLPENKKDFAFSIAYAPEMLENMRLSLIEGEMFTEYSERDNIVPVIISGPISHIYSVGDTFEAEMGQERAEYSFLVVGVTEDNTSVITFTESEGVPDLSKLLQSREGLNDPNFIYFVSADIRVLKMGTESRSGVMKLGNDKSADNRCKELNAELNSFCEFYTISEVYLNSFKKTAYEYNVLFLIALLLFVITLFGYGGYMMVMFLQKGKVFSVLFINGMSYFKLLILQIVSGFLIYIPASVFGAIMAPLYSENILRKEWIFDIRAFMFAFVLLIFIFLMGTLGSVIRLRSMSIVNGYRNL